MNSESDGDALYKEKTLRALRGHVGELDAMEKAIRHAAQSKTEIPNLREVLEALAAATEEVHGVHEYYRDEEMPNEIFDLIQHHLLRGLIDCQNALVLYSALIGFRGGS